MKTLLKLIPILLFCFLLFAACKKTAGPKGDPGAAGAQGPSGAQGPAGSANIQVQTFTTTTSDWTSYSWPYEYVEATLTFSAINSAVMSGGDVRVYMLDPTGTMWMGMPYSYITNQYTYKYKSGQVILNLTLSTGAAPINPGAQQFKVVVIPPALIKKYPGMNWNNFDEIKDLM